MGKPAARVGDMHTCPMVTPGTPPIPHVGGPILPPGCPTVLIGGMPAARVGDMALCVGPPDSIVLGSPTVLIGGMMAARMGDNTAHGGVIVVGMPTVLIGEAGGGSAGQVQGKEIADKSANRVQAPTSSPSDVVKGAPSSKARSKRPAPRGRTPVRPKRPRPRVLTSSTRLRAICDKPRPPKKPPASIRGAAAGYLLAGPLGAAIGYQLADQYSKGTLGPYALKKLALGPMVKGVLKKGALVALRTVSANNPLLNVITGGLAAPITEALYRHAQGKPVWSTDWRKNLYVYSTSALKGVLSSLAGIVVAGAISGGSGGALTPAGVVAGFAVSAATSVALDGLQSALEQKFGISYMQDL